MLVLREADYITVPWKNGGGVTREILRVPPEPTPFDWRLSLATIAAGGPFSAFEGYDRTLVLVRGAGVELNFARHGGSKLTAPGQSVSFDGAWQTSCILLDGPSTDLNLIVSRQRSEYSSRSVQLTDPESVQTAHWSEVLVCCLSGALRVANTTGESERLNGVDIARCLPADGAITCTPQGTVPPNVFIASVRRREPGSHAP